MHDETYPDLIGRALKPRASRPEKVLDLFAGCGGLALGFEAAGFETFGYEANPDCCATYNKNLLGTCRQEFLTSETIFPNADIVIGGPPCQPFSVSGNQKGLEDPRNGFPAFIAAVEQLRPKLWLFENVRGLLYRSRWYLDQVIHRLERLGYVTDVRLLNAVDFSVPQNRERLIVVGHRGEFRFPDPEHQKVTAGQALGEYFQHEPADGKYLTRSMDAYVARYELASKCVNPRDLHPDRPSRTVTCRNLAGATGDMQRIKLANGRRRRLSVREGARLQSFPDWFEFEGAEGSQYSQVGNAVAPMFALALANSVVRHLDNPRLLDKQEIRARWTMLQTSIAMAGADWHVGQDSKS